MQQSDGRRRRTNCRESTEITRPGSVLVPENHGLCAGVYRMRPESTGGADAGPVGYLTKRGVNNRLC